MGPWDCFLPGWASPEREVYGSPRTSPCTFGGTVEKSCGPLCGKKSAVRGWAVLLVKV